MNSTPFRRLVTPLEDVTGMICIKADEILGAVMLLGRCRYLMRRHKALVEGAGDNQAHAADTSESDLSLRTCIDKAGRTRVVVWFWVGGRWTARIHLKSHLDVES